MHAWGVGGQHLYVTKPSTKVISILKLSNASKLANGKEGRRGGKKHYNGAFKKIAFSIDSFCPTLKAISRIQKCEAEKPAEF